MWKKLHTCSYCMATGLWYYYCYYPLDQAIIPEITYIKGINFQVPSHWFVVTLNQSSLKWGNLYNGFMLLTSWHISWIECLAIYFLHMLTSCVCNQFGVLSLILSLHILDVVSWKSQSILWKRCSEARKLYCLWYFLRPCTIKEEMTLIQKTRSYSNDAKHFD